MTEKRESGSSVVAPGTLVLVAIFFVFFVLMFLANLFQLSQLWPVR